MIFDKISCEWKMNGLLFDLTYILSGQYIIDREICLDHYSLPDNI